MCSGHTTNYNADFAMSPKRKGDRRRGVVSVATGKTSATNSLDWDSPSTKTGTVKRRPPSGECDEFADMDGKYGDRSIYEPMSPLEKNGLYRSLDGFLVRM